MSRKNWLAIAVLVLVFETATGASNSISVTISPLIVREYTSYSIRCQYPSPPVNGTSTGLLQVTHLSNNEAVYTYDFDALRETVSSSIQPRSSALLNQTSYVLVINVSVALTTDSGLYNCSLVSGSNSNSNNSFAYYATTSAPLNVTGCANGSQVASFTGCPSVSLGSPCSVVCSSTVDNGTVSLSRSYDGSNPLFTDLNEVNYTIASVSDVNYGTYYCYVKTAACISMRQADVTQAPASTTTPPPCAKGCRSGLAGWKIALIVVFSIIGFILLVLLILFLLYKKGLLKKNEEVEPGSHGPTRAVANENFAISKAKSNGTNDRYQKTNVDSNANSAAAVINFPEVKTRKNQLPPLQDTHGGSTRRSIQPDDSPRIGMTGRPLPKRNSSINESGSPGRRLPTIYGRRDSGDEGFPEPAQKVPPIRLSAREEEEDDRF